MHKKTTSTILAAAVTGLLMGGATGCKSTSKADSATSRAMPAKHACKGMNACKGQGGCKSGDNGCAGKNSCKGKGGCAVPVKH